VNCNDNEKGNENAGSINDATEPKRKANLEKELCKTFPQLGGILQGDADLPSIFLAFAPLAYRNKTWHVDRDGSKEIII